jgi:hypothetical protein
VAEDWIKALQHHIDESRVLEEKDVVSKEVK